MLISNNIFYCYWDRLFISLTFAARVDDYCASGWPSLEGVDLIHITLGHVISGVKEAKQMKWSRGISSVSYCANQSPSKNLQVNPSLKFIILNVGGRQCLEREDR